MAIEKSTLNIGKTLLSFPSLEEGILLKRYKRFLADVELKSGEMVTAHCANTGPMQGVLRVGSRVRLRYCPSPTRKLKWTWEQVEVLGEKNDFCWVGINTSIANKIVRQAIEYGLLTNELGIISVIRPEVTYGLNGRSRVDFLLKPSENNKELKSIYLEVKNTTWAKKSVAIFPDTVTKRGQKHLNELVNVLPTARAVLVFCIARNDISAFAPGDSADMLYANLFRFAVSKGVEIIPCCFGFYSNKITWEGTRPFQMHD